MKRTEGCAIMTETTQILTGLENGIWQIQINRPEKKNALNSAMYAAMTEALNSAESDPAVRVVLITGTEGVFTSGNDVADFLNMPEKPEDAPVVQFLHALARAPKPIIAAVNGLAVGIGTTMLLHCDLVYAADSATFKLPFVNLGLCPEAASSYLLPLTVGHQRAAQLLLLGEPIDAPTAMAWGLVNEVHPLEKLEAVALEKAQQLAALAPSALRVSKALMKQPRAEAARDVMAEEITTFMQRLRSPEVAEAFQAFVQRRKPDFSQFQ